MGYESDGSYGLLHQDTHIPDWAVCWVSAVLRALKTDPGVAKGTRAGINRQGQSRAAGFCTHCMDTLMELV